MARADMLSILYSKEKSPLEFNFDSLYVPSMYNYILPQDIYGLYNIASSTRYASNIELKYKAIDDIMKSRGFKKFHSGTNRVVYSYLEDSRFLFKIALDKVGLGDNPAEYRNQFLLKPFVTKTFEISPCGTVGVAERVQPITSREEFKSIASDVFELLNNFIIGKYVVDDIGSKYFMNYGIRLGQGPVILDYTYVYELDGNKLYCNKFLKSLGHICNGIIDYDAGFNSLVCTKCGKKYFAHELKQNIDNKIILLKDEGEIDMKVSVMRGKQVISTVDTGKETNTIRRDNRKPISEPKAKELHVTVTRGGRPVDGVTVEDIYKQKLEEKTNKEVIQTQTVKVDLNNPLNNNLEENTNFNVESTFIPSANTLKEAILNNEVKPEVKVEDKEKSIEQPIEENKQKPCYGKYCYEDLECMKCKDASICSTESDNDEPQYNKNKKNIMDEY